jgi:hypothetical protein
MLVINSDKDFQIVFYEAVIIGQLWIPEVIDSGSKGPGG